MSDTCFSAVMVGPYDCIHSWVISKDTVWNSWDILNAILGHTYHQNHSNRVISSERSQHLQQHFDYSLGKWVSSVHDRLFCRHQHSESMHGYLETRSKSNLWQEHMHTDRQQYDKTHFCCKFMTGAYAHWQAKNMIKLTFCWTFWVYLLHMTQFGWFWWYLWPKMAYEMSQEFRTASLDIGTLHTVRPG